MVVPVVRGGEQKASLAGTIQSNAIRYRTFGLVVVVVVVVVVTYLS